MLWFSSVLWRVDRVVLAFRDYDAVPGLGQRRAAALAELPYRVTCLGIPEAGSWHLADWANPRITEFGLALNSPSASRRYEANFHILRSRLRAELTSDTAVFTHNPWGEYGHEDHVQLYRVLEGLRREIGFRMWVPTYSSTWSAALAARYARSSDARLCRFPVDRIAAARIAGLYRKHDCWTWWSDAPWPAEECFVSTPLNEVATRQEPSAIPVSCVALPQ